MDAILVKANTLPDAWFQLVFNLIRGDHSEFPRTVYQIDKGSYVGQKRLEFQFVTVQIDNPGVRPLIPEFPPAVSVPPPVEGMEYVDRYFVDYLMATKLAENETYIYGTWLAPGVERVIEQLRDSPGNNQAAISIGGWAPDGNGPITEMKASQKTIEPLRVWFTKGSEHSSACIDTDNFIDPGTGQRDPACLRLVDFRLDQDNRLHMVLYFRSWDLWGGFPANLAGMQLVKEYVAQAIGAEDGRIIAQSKGLHLYDHAVKIAAERVGMDVDEDEFFRWLKGNL